MSDLTAEDWMTDAWQDAFYAHSYAGFAARQYDISAGMHASGKDERFSFQVGDRMFTFVVPAGGSLPVQTHKYLGITWARKADLVAFAR